MNIFTKIKNSIYGPEYYGEVIGKPFSYSLKYYLVFALLFALAFTIVVTVMFIPLVNSLPGRIAQVSNYFPQDLTINIKNGKVSTNVQEPYFIKMPQELKNQKNIQPDLSKLDNVVVIDTKDKFNIDTFNSYKTFMLLTSDSVAYIDKNNQISVSPLSNVKDFTLNRSEVAGFLSKLKPYLVLIYPFVFVGAYFVGFMVVLAEMLYLLFGALLVWLIAGAKGAKMKIGYKKSYQLSMHLVTPVIIITSIINALSLKFTIPFLFTILLILSALLNLRKNVAPSDAIVA